MPTQHVEKIACVNASPTILRFRAQASGSDNVRSQFSQNLAQNEFAVIELKNVEGAKNNETHFGIVVQLEPFDIDAISRTATVTFSKANIARNTYVATYVVTGSALDLKATLIE